MKFFTLAIALLLSICVGAAQAAPQTPANSQAAAGPRTSLADRRWNTLATMTL